MNNPCPSCGYDLDLDDCTTYDGDGNPHDVTCPQCHVALLVNECVVRTFTITKAIPATIPPFPAHLRLRQLPGGA